MIGQQGGVRPEKEFHGLLGGGVLAIWCDVDAEVEVEFNHWYTHQHLPERVGIPGFLRGRRYAAAPGSRPRPGARYFTLYETETVETLASDAYLVRLNNPTEWTRQMVARFRNGNRTACRVAASLGQGIGAHAATIEFAAGSGSEGELRDWLRSEAMPGCLEKDPALVAVHLLEADEATTRAKDGTEESSTSPGLGGERAGWVLMVEGMFETAVAAACRALSEGMPARGAAGEVAVSRYQLLVSLSE